MNVQMTLIDHKGYLIDEEIFEDVVKNYSKHDNFEIKLVYDVDYSKMDKVATPWVRFFFALPLLPNFSYHNFNTRFSFAHFS